NKKVWLDIELSDASLLTDLQPKIMALVKNFPVEVLLVRREKQVRKRLMLQNQQNQSTLNELTLMDVFDSRLQQEPWLSIETKDVDEDEQQAQRQARKEKLQTLFKQTVEQVQAAGKL
ncbi:MAG: exonuclease SbcCD subunit D C-terminal domain-containing protein, partial [Colwellia sp.]|nr:exonuclease SbcCD subunit D C-terminal domain-containing protein [Colwellia sp.]